MINPQPPVSAELAIKNGTASFAWLSYFSLLTNYISGLPKSGAVLDNYANDAAAETGGVPLYGYYRNGSVVMQRVV